MQATSHNARVWAEIDLAALLHNYRLALGGGRRVMCVVKANAYGHGAARCGRFLEAHGAYAFAVASLDEALELRRAGIERPVLILGYTPPEFARELFENDITQTFVDEAHALALDAAANAAGVRISAHIKLDTGMSRAGLFAQGPEAAEDAALAAARMMRLENAAVTGVYTHFAVADTPCERAFTALQLESYKRVLARVRDMGLDPGLCHASNSAGILNHPEADFDMVRAGAMLYGLYPDSQPADGPLKPVMTLKSRVAGVKRFPAGATVSYGRAFQAQKPMDIALVLAGYADGYPRRLSNRAWECISGARCDQIGAICMDMHMADVTGKDVRIGDAVTLIGAGAMSWEQAAALVGTINYELTCLVTGRTERVYIDQP